MLNNWKQLNETSVFETKIFKILQRHYQKPNNLGEFKAFVLHTFDWANIIPITKTKEFLLIRQFRFGTNKIEWEIPGGVIDANESPLQAAQRELEEETGFKTSEWEQIGVVDANPAIQTNKCYTFLAHNVEPTGNINFDPDEMIEYHKATEENVKHLIQTGKITNTYIIAAFFWYFNRNLRKETDENKQDR